MVEIQIAYKGDLRCVATHVQSGTTLVTDAPLDNMGRGESFSPTDLVATALGACMMTIMGIAARKHEIDLSGTTVRVLKEMVSAPERRVGTLTVEFTIPAAATPQQRIALERAAMACPVHRSISAEVQMPVTFHWTSLHRQ
jgi:putative redox protein